MHQLLSRLLAPAQPMQQCEKLRLRDPIASGLTKDKLLRRATASAINIIIIIIIIITIKRERERELLLKRETEHLNIINIINIINCYRFFAPTL